MENVVMGNLDGEIQRVAFVPEDLEQIISRYGTSLLFSGDEPGLFIELNGRVYPVEGPVDKRDIKPYFIILKSGIAYNAHDYRILFNVRELSKNLLSGTDVTGNQHFCRIHTNGKRRNQGENKFFDIRSIDERIESGGLTNDEIEDLKQLIQKLKGGEFFELLTMEFSGKIKEIAKELIDFRKDIQTKIEPDIVEMASRDIPEASNQLEAIIETLEDSTMKIMDINEEHMEISSRQRKMLESLLSSKEKSKGISIGISLEEAVQTIENQIDVLKDIEDRSLRMMEPLSFQDLVGQRIQKIIRLVRSMEMRIEELIVSFGIKLVKHKENPLKSYEELNRDVDRYMTELKGPQRSGEGLDQAGIDDLLNSL